VKWKVSVVLGLLIVALLQYQLWFSEDGVMTILTLKRAITVQKQDNQQFARYNSQLAKEINRWKHSRAPIEHRARHELGMIHQGEVFYRYSK
jgi:cell division protein FtsB